MSPRSHGFDYLFLVRPVLLYPIWIFFLAGVWSMAPFRPFVSFGILSSAQWIAFLAVTLIMAAAYVLNQIQDIDTDRINGKKFLIATGHISVKAAYVEAFFLILLGLWIGILVNRITGFLLLILWLSAGILYNYPPFRWKDKPIAGLLTNGLGGVLIYMIGWASQGDLTFHPLRILLFGLAGMAVTLNTTLPDVEGDKKTGKITFAVRYGIRVTCYLAFLFELATVILAFVLQEWLLFFSAAAAFPFFLVAVMKQDLKTILKATRISVLGFALAVCVFFPWFLMLALCVFFGTKLYYAKRFQFNYPSFSTKEETDL